MSTKLPEIPPGSGKITSYTLAATVPAPGTDRELLSNKHALTALDLISPEFKEIMKIRRFVPPQGYLSPNTVEVALALPVALDMEATVNGTVKKSPADANAICMGCWQAMHGWPMFAVTPDLARAMMLTDPPGDITWGELQWPLPAVTFLFPDIPELREYLNIGEVPPAVCMGRLLRPPSDVAVGIGQLLGKSRMPDGSFTRDMLLMIYFDEEEQKTVMHDITSRPEWTLASSWSREMARMDEGFGALPFKESDFLRLERTIKLSVNLLAFMTSTYQPETVTDPSLIPLRKAKEKGKKKLDALYGVRWLGQGYRLKRPPMGGHHQSPHWHWRRGHFRKQPVGPGRTQTKVIWIEPFVVPGRDRQEGGS